MYYEYIHLTEKAGHQSRNLIVWNYSRSKPKMPTCTVANASSIYCEHGCCGTVQDRSCCQNILSEEVIIVICSVGALFVVAVVVALIICLTSKNKDRVTPIRQTQRRPRRENERRRPRREVYPKPPPYSEAPPRYETIQTPVDLRPSPNSTDPILPGTVERNVTSDRRQRVGQNRRQRRNNLGRNAIEPSPIDAPPPYVSVVDVESPIHQTARYSAGPSTSGAASQNHGVTPFIEDIDGRNGRGSPHPSLASADIHLATDHERGHRLHRTVSERSPFVTPLPTVGGATLRVVGSGTPVTIREITVHSQLIQNMHGTNGREQTRNVSFQQPEAVHRNTRIPRPVPRVKTVNTDQTTNEPSLNSVQKLDRRVRSGAEAGTSDITNVHPRHNNPAKSVSNKRLKTENTTTVLPSAVSNSNSKRLGHKTVTATDDNLSAEDLSTNLKPSMAVRREKRQAILVKLRERKQNISPTNSQ